MIPQRSRARAAALAVLGLLPALAAQSQPAKDARRVELDAQLGKELSKFARTVSTQKWHTLAREIAALVVEHYDADDNTARRLLGQRKVRGSWQQDKPKSQLPGDGIDDRRRQGLAPKWQELQQRAGALHRDLGMRLLDEGAKQAAQREFDLALWFLPDDAQVHRALGHQQFEGLWGTAEDIAFCKRMQAIVGKANELAQKDYEVTEVPLSELPPELKATGLTFAGARGPNYTYWLTDSFEAAASCVTWSERCHELLKDLLGADAEILRGNAWRWHAILRTGEQRDALLQKSPTTMGPFKFDQARLFAGLGFAAEGGGRAAVTWQPQNLDADYSVANVTKRHLQDQRNEGLGEGLTHVTTWLLCGTTRTWFADLPKTVVGDAKPMGRDPKEWLQSLWKEIDEGRDFPLLQVPRERADNFRDSARLKAWSFMCWMLARYPDKWWPLIMSLSGGTFSEEDCAHAFEEVLGRPVAEIDAEWRRWARRGSKLGEASGWTLD